MLDFRPITLDDKPIFDEFFIKQKVCNSVNDFATIYCWNIENNSRYAVVDDEALISYGVYNGRKIYYCPVLKKGYNISPYIKLIQDYEQGNCYKINQITEKYLPYIKDLPGFTLQYDRDNSDYIYLRDELATLKGNKFHAKRNHLNKFLSSYNYEFRLYKDSDYDECLELFDIWYKDNEGGNIHEKEALTRALKYQKILGLTVAVITVDGKVKAFAVVGRIPGCKTGNVHFEKADITYEGIFAAINYFASNNFFAHMKYINRQEDMGIEGLRKSKMSYNPAFLLNKYSLIPKLD